MLRRFAFTALAVVIVGTSSYLFRPDLPAANRQVDEMFPALAAAPVQQPEALLSGHFHDVAHEGTGVATVYELADGSKTLRLTQFHTSNGPDLRVYLVAAADALDSATVTGADIVDLGALKRNMGDQNYDLPQDIDLGKYRSVSIWCKRFSVNFTTAPLRPGPAL